MPLRDFVYQNEYRFSYADYGPPDGFPILVQHGLIASIKDAALFQPLLELGARLICVARPGYGQSAPYEMENMAEWGRIVAVLIDDLHLEQFDIFGISSGAPYSYSIGYRFPHKTRNIFILSGTPALYDETVLSLWPYPVQKGAGIAELQTLAHELFFSDLSARDLEQDNIRDSMMNGAFGVAQDLRLRCQGWGFTLAEITPQVIMRHSRSDDSVPWRTAEITAQGLPHCRCELREHDPHFSPQMVEDFVLTAMADCFRKK